MEFGWGTTEVGDAHDYLYEPVRSRLSLGDKVLDLGCGDASLTGRLRRHVDEIVGIEPSSDGVKTARRLQPSIAVRQRDLAEPLEDDLRGSFSVVVAVEVIEHLLLPRQLFERAREALTPGGFLLITTPYHGYFKNLALALTNRFDEHWHPGRDFGHVKFFSRRTLDALASDAGFDVTEWFYVGRVRPLAKSMGACFRVRTSR